MPKTGGSGLAGGAAGRGGRAGVTLLNNDNNGGTLSDTFTPGTPGSASAPETKLYRRFRDVPEDGWNYKGTGAAQQKFFANYSNAYTLMREIAGNPSVRKAFLKWCGGHFMSGQQYSGWDNMTGEDQGYTRAYDNILDRATLNYGVTLARRSTAELIFGAGTISATLEEFQAQKGKTITCSGNMSFGAAAQGLTIGSSSRAKPVEYRLAIQGGSVGAGMWIGDSSVNHWGPDQREFITNRDINLRVGNSRYDASRGVIVVDLVYAGRNPHDYGSS